MSQRNSEYKRIENEAYYTPHWVTECLIKCVPFNDRNVIWDPAFGEGHILDVFEGHGKCTLGTDIITGLDFMDATAPYAPCHIVANPPYGSRGTLAEKFIEHALKLASAHGAKVAMLLRADFNHAKTRRHLFFCNDHFALELKILKRIQWANIEPTASPSQNHSWFVWDTSRIYNRHDVGATHPDDFMEVAHEAA